MRKVILLICFLIIVSVICLKNMNNTVETSTDTISQNNTIGNNLLENELDGKEIAFLGDSLIEGYGSEHGGFEYYLQKLLPNSKIINNSKSGSTVTNNTGIDNIVMINQVKTLTANPDIIIFNGGANDIIGYGMEFLNNDLKKEIGTVNKNLEEMSDENTVIRDFEEIIIELQKKFPKAELCYLQLFLIDDETINKIVKDKSNISEMKSRRDKFYIQIKLLCEKRGVKYVDVSDTFDETDKNFRKEDWIHLNDEAYKIISEAILEELK